MKVRPLEFEVETAKGKVPVKLSRHRKKKTNKYIETGRAYHGDDPHYERKAWEINKEVLTKLERGYLAMVSEANNSFEHLNLPNQADLIKKRVMLTSQLLRDAELRPKELEILRKITRERIYSIYSKHLNSNSYNYEKHQQILDELGPIDDMDDTLIIIEENKYYISFSQSKFSKLLRSLHFKSLYNLAKQKENNPKINHFTQRLRDLNMSYLQGLVIHFQDFEKREKEKEKAKSGAKKKK
jgi:hypothetical protein